MIRSWTALAALALVAPAPVLACSPVPPPKVPPTRAQIDRELRATFAWARDLVDYVVVQRATNESKGAIRVTRSYKGATRKGAVIPIWTSDGAACGSGNAERGTRGRMFLSGKAPYQYRDLPDQAYDGYARLKLVPAR